MFSSNGTAPGTMELVSFEVGLIHSFFGVGGGGTPSMLWDMTFHPVTYTNPVSGAATDGRRYPNLAAAPILTILGGPLALPLPPGCAAPQYWTYSLAFELGTATPGSGISLPADGLTEHAWMLLAAGGHEHACSDRPERLRSRRQPVDDDPHQRAEPGRRRARPVRHHDRRRDPAPTGVNRNPFHGSGPRDDELQQPSERPGLRHWPGFREPILQFRFFSTGAPTVRTRWPALSAARAPHTGRHGHRHVSPGMRTCASGHLGDLVIHVLTADPVNYPSSRAPGIAVTPTSNLMLQPGRSELLPD